MYAVWFVYDTPKCHRMLRRGPRRRLGLFLQDVYYRYRIRGGFRQFPMYFGHEDIVTAIGFLPKCVVAPN